MISGLFGIDGRIGRGMWWLGHLILYPIIILAIVSAIGGVGAKSDFLLSIAGISLLVIVLALLPCAYISVATTIQRFHDRGKSGWWFLLSFVPFIGPIWVLIECGFCSGDDGDNEYGPPPGAAARLKALDREVGGMATSASGRLSKLDDDYLNNYARESAMKQASQQMALASSFAPAGPGRPVFGKR